MEEKKEETQTTAADEDIRSRIAQEQKLKDVEQLIQDKAEEPAPDPGLAPHIGDDEEYKFIRVDSLDELKDRVRRVCATLEKKEEDLYNKSKFPYRIAMVLGTTAFFLAMVISFFSEQPIQIVVKRSISSFFLFAFLGWLFGLLTNYFSPPLQAKAGDGEEEKGSNIDYSTDLDAEFDQYKDGKTMAADTVVRRGPEPKPEKEKNKEPEDRPPTADEIQESLSKTAKEAPEQIAQVIKGVLSRSDK